MNYEDVVKYLHMVDPNKSTTPECIHPRIIKECANQLAPALCHIYKMSLNTGSVPTKWKHGTVSPIHKSGTRHEASNYRPITITSLLCRV